MFKKKIGTEYIYNLTWGDTLDTNIFIKSNCNPEFMEKAIERKNELLSTREYEGYGDSEILAEIFFESKFTFENITPEVDYVFSF